MRSRGLNANGENQCYKPFYLKADATLRPKCTFSILMTNKNGNCSMLFTRALMTTDVSDAG